MAKIFRLQNNVPDVYVKKSRDFQLMCNLFDILQGGVKYDIDSITTVVDTRYCNEKLLPLLQSKLGFFTNKHLTTKELRTVLTSFQDIVKDKGSTKGIREAIELYLKVIGASRDSRIIITNKDNSQNTDSIIRFNNSYIVEVSIEGQLTDLTLLTELLRYVLPAGYRLKYSFYQASKTINHIIEKGTINIIIVSSAINNRIASTTSDSFEDKIVKYVFANGKVSTDSVDYFTYKDGEYILIKNDDLLKSNLSQLAEDGIVELAAEFELIKTGTVYVPVGPESKFNYSKGKDIKNLQTYEELLANDAIGYVFTESAVQNGIYYNDVDVMGTQKKYFVQAGDKWDINITYYDSNDQEIANNDKMLLFVQCIWIAENDPLKTDSENLYYKVTNTYYIFTQTQTTYYQKYHDIVAYPGAISTSSVANRDTEYTKIPQNDSSDATYTFKTLNMNKETDNV